MHGSSQGVGDRHAARTCSSVLARTSLMARLAAPLGLALLVAWGLGGRAEVVRVGFYENPPKIMTDDTGRIEGFFPSILEAIADAEEWTLDYVPGTWAEGLERLSNGEIDLMPDVAYSGDRATRYAFSQETLFVNWGVIYVRPGTTVNAISDLAGRVLAIMRGSIHTEGEEGIRTLLGRFHIDVEYLEVDDYAGAFERTASGAADAAVVNRLFGARHAARYGVVETPVFFNPIELRFAAPLDNARARALLDRIDERVRAMKADPDSVYRQSLSALLVMPETQERLPVWSPWVLGGVGMLVIGLGATLWALRCRHRRLRRSTRDALRLSESRWRHVIDALPMGAHMYRLTPDGHLVFVGGNPAADRILGIDHRPLVGKDLEDAFPALADTDVPEAYRRVADTERSWSTEQVEYEDERIVGAFEVHAFRLEPRTVVALFVEITSRLQLENELRRHQDHLEGLVTQRTSELDRAMDAAHATRVLLDLERDRVTVDDRWHKMVEWKASDPPTTQEEWIAWIHPDDREPVCRALERVAHRTACETKIEYRILRSSGEIRHIESHSSVIRGPDGVARRIVGLHLDVTERVRAEAALRSREALLRATIDSLPAHFWATDRDLRFTVQNEESRRAIGHAVGRTMDELDLPTVLRSGWLEDNRRVLQGETIDQEYAFPVDGDLRDFVARISPIHVDDQIVGTIGISFDITERKRAEEALQEQEAYLRTLMESMPIDFFALDRDMRYTMQSRLSQEVVGDVIGKNVSDVSAPEKLKRQWAKEHAEVLGGETIHREYQIPAEGRMRTFMTTVAPVRVGDEIVGTIGTSMDISERERMASALRRARDELEERVQERTRALRRSERELRAVLEGTIKAFARTVEARDPYTAGHQEHVAHLAVRIARKLGLSDEDVETTRVASLLHDIGKISIPAEILTKPTALVPAEWEMFRRHPENAYRILEGIRFPWPIAHVVLSHHERIDGTGYPHGLQGEEIPVPARIISVADTVEAMASHRPYREAVGLEAALETLREGRDTLFDPRVVDACLELFESDGYTFPRKRG